MLRKLTKVVTIGIVVGSNMLFAGNVTDVLNKQEALSHKAVVFYKKHKTKALLSQIHTLKAQNRKLQRYVRDPEIKNLLVFLDICLDEMKSTLNKPYSKDNAQIIADLSVSIKEGTHYVKRALKI